MKFGESIFPSVVDLVRALSEDTSTAAPLIYSREKGAMDRTPVRMATQIITAGAGSRRAGSPSGAKIGQKRASSASLWGDCGASEKPKRPKCPPAAPHVISGCALSYRCLALRTSYFPVYHIGIFDDSSARCARLEACLGRNRDSANFNPPANRKEGSAWSIFREVLKSKMSRVAIKTPLRSNVICTIKQIEE